MAGTEGFAALRIGLLDPHIWISVSDDLFCAALTRFDHELLWPLGCAPRLVTLHFGFIDFCHCNSANENKV